MLPSEKFELAIYKWVNAVGPARSVNVADFFNMPGSNGQYAMVVDRLRDLYMRRCINLYKYIGNVAVAYDKVVDFEGENAFFGGGFVIEIAPGGRKFFEELEAREEPEKRSKVEPKPQSPIKPQLSQPTLGALRRSLEQMESSDIITPHDRRTFWKNELFDFGFPPTVIDVANTYQFKWSEIIPDLFLRKLGKQNENFSNALPEYVCEQTLNSLLAFALHQNKATPAASELREFLRRDGFDLKPAPAVDSSIPSELAHIPGKPVLLNDLQQRLDGHELTAVLYMDLDGFKQVNDQLTHEEGDKCLARVVALLSAVVAGKGKLYRPHGDEFVVILPNFTRQEAAATAERIRATVDDANPGGKLKVTVSIGVTDSESKAATDAQALVTAADRTMYKAKKTTKNCVVVDDGFDATEVSKISNVVDPTVYGETD